MIRIKRKTKPNATIKAKKAPKKSKPCKCHKGKNVNINRNTVKVGSSPAPQFMPFAGSGGGSSSTVVQLPPQDQTAVSILLGMLGNNTTQANPTVQSPSPSSIINNTFSASTLPPTGQNLSQPVTTEFFAPTQSVPTVPLTQDGMAQTVPPTAAAEPAETPVAMNVDDTTSSTSLNRPNNVDDRVRNPKRTVGNVSAEFDDSIVNAFNRRGEFPQYRAAAQFGQSRLPLFNADANLRGGRQNLIGNNQLTIANDEDD